MISSKEQDLELFKIIYKAFDPTITVHSPEDELQGIYMAKEIMLQYDKESAELLDKITLKNISAYRQIVRLKLGTIIFKKHDLFKEKIV